MPWREVSPEVEGIRVAYSLASAVRDADRKSLEVSATFATFSALVVPAPILARTTLACLDIRCCGVQEGLYVANDRPKIFLVPRGASKSANNPVFNVDKYDTFAMETII